MRNNNNKATSKAAAKQSAAAKRPGGGGKVKSMKHQAAAVSVSGKQPPLKVVHISNPMRVEVKPADFRKLVQELTGRHAADWPEHPSWNNSVTDFALGNIGNDRCQVLLAPPPAEVEVVEVEEEGSLDDVDSIKVGCDFGSDLSFYGDRQMLLNLDQEDLISSFYG